MERETLPALRAKGDLDLSSVDIDKQQDMAAALFDPLSRNIPQWVLCERTANGAFHPIDWLVGAASAAAVEKFVHSDHIHKQEEASCNSTCATPPTHCQAAPKHQARPARGWPTCFTSH